MLKGIANSEKVKFTLKEDTENPTIFWIKNISQEKKLTIWADMNDQNGKADNMKALAKSLDIFVSGLAGIDNLGANAESNTGNIHSGS